MIFCFIYFSAMLSVTLSFQNNHSNVIKNNDWDVIGAASLIPGFCNRFRIHSTNYSEEFICPNGLDYNNLYRNCDYSRNAGCRIECTQKKDKMPFFEECGVYVLCKNSQPVIMSCPSGTYYNRWIKACLPGHEDECLLKCPEPFGVFPIKGSMKHYVVCHGYHPFVYTCPKDLDFDANRSTCGHVSHKSALRMVQCPKPDGIFGNEESCALYTVCVHNEGKTYSCPPSLLFDAFRLVCDYPERATCTKSLSTEYFKAFSDDYLSLKPKEMNLLSYCPESTISGMIKRSGYAVEVEDKQSMCPERNGFYADVDNCSSFITCQNGEAIEKMICLSGLHYNQATSMCDHPQNVHWIPQCSHRKQGVPGLCNAYISCDGEQKINFCHSSLHFNFATERCDLPTSVGCEPLCPDTSEYAVVKGQCGMAYRCVKGEAVDVISCPPGLYFDVAAGNCDFPVNVDCPWKSNDTFLSDLKEKFDDI